MYKVSLDIRQLPGAVFDILKIREGDMGSWHIYKFDVVVKDQVQIQINAGLFNNFYITFAGGRSRAYKGEYWGIISKDSVKGVNISWGERGHPPIKISRWPWG